MASSIPVASSMVDHGISRATNPSITRTCPFSSPFPLTFPATLRPPDRGIPIYQIAGAYTRSLGRSQSPLYCVALTST